MRGRLKTAIVGPGHWGKNVARELNAVSDPVAYSGTDPTKNAEWARQHIPQARYLTIDEICADPAIAAVAVATPVPLLAPVARRLIDAGKHVLVEKPLAQLSAEASRLADAAAARGRTLATGYVFVYHPVYQEMKRRIGAQAIRRMTLRWEKFGTFTDAIEQSLLCHHLALALDWLGEPTGGDIRRGPGIESACDRIETRLAYPHAEVSSFIDRAAARPAHVVTVESVDGTRLEWDGYRLFDVRDDARTEIVLSDTRPALACEVSQFIEAAGGAGALPTGGAFAARVLAMLETFGRR